MSPSASLLRARRKVALGWAVVGMVAVAICAALYLQDRHQVEQTNLEREVTRSDFFGSLFDPDYRSTRSDLRVLAQSDDLQDSLRNGSASSLSRFEHDILHRLEQEPEYDEIRFIDEAGREGARVSRARGIAPTDALGPVAAAYFGAALALPKNQVYISPLTVAVRGGRLVEPLLSYFRMATPVFDLSGRRRGIVAIDFLGSALFARLSALSPQTRSHLRVLNAEGYWLRAQNPADEWGFARPGQQGNTLARTDPDLWNQIIAHPKGQHAYRGGWFTWHRIDPYAAVGQPARDDSFLIAASELPAAEWAALHAGRSEPYLIVGAVLILAIASAAAMHDSRVQEREMKEEALRLAHDNAQESARLKAQFLANMSHEIRTPMNGVVGMVGLLLDTPLTSEQRSYANTVRTSADALLALINDILDFSKIEAGQLEFEDVPFDLRDPVENCLSLAAEKAHAKGLELASLVEENVPTSLIGDPHRLHQVLLNLVGNAVKFTGKGEVVLRVTKVADEGGKVRLRFSIRDTGPGVPPETAARLFQPFVQGDSSTSRKFGGTGLGLAICRQLVTLMGGEIGVESGTAGGATFWFTALFPVAPAAPRVVPRKGELKGMRALVVDDNATNREILTRELASWQIEAQAAEGADDALRRLRDAATAGVPFQFALLDMEMPGMSGLEAARATGEDPALSGLRKVILTSVGRTLPREVLAAAGVSACLIKPARRSALHDALVEAAAGPALPTASASVSGAAEPERPPTPAPGDLSLRILVVEDNLVNQHVARLQLEKFGSRPDIVSGGMEALAAVRQRRYDVILMDCQMPGVDGFEATRRIRVWEVERRVAGETVEPIPIVAMTANAMAGDRDLCLAAGMQDYITKPVRAEELAAALARSQVRGSA